MTASTPALSMPVREASRSVSRGAVRAIALTSAGDARARLQLERDRCCKYGSNASDDMGAFVPDYGALPGELSKLGVAVRDSSLVNRSSTPGLPDKSRKHNACTMPECFPPVHTLVKPSTHATALDVSKLDAETRSASRAGNSCPN